MSFTKSQEVYLGVHEGGLNDALTAFYNERHRPFDIGSQPYVGPTSAQQSQYPPITIFGPPIPWRIQFSQPKVDLYPKTSTLSPLGLAQGQFGAEVALQITVAGVTLSLQVFVAGHLVQIASTGGPAISFVVDQIATVPSPTGPFVTFLQTLLILILNDLFAQVKLPLSTLAFGPLHVTAGPDVEQDSVKIYGQL
jgi:hypothetical protein